SFWIAIPHFGRRQPGGAHGFSFGKVSLCCELYSRASIRLFDWLRHWSLAASSGFAFTVGSGPFSVAVDPAEHFVYVANSLSDTISVLSLDASTGTLTSLPNSPFTADKNPVSLAIDSAGKFLYVANLGGNNVSAFSLDSTTGVPTELTTPKSPFAAGTRPIFATIDSTGKFLYVANENSRDISGFNIDSSTGGLTNGSIAASVGSAPTSIATTTK